MIEETPTGGKKRERLTERKIRKIVDTAEREIRGELAKQYREEKKAMGSSSNEEHPEAPPEAPIAQSLKQKYAPVQNPPPILRGCHHLMMVPGLAGRPRSYC